MEVKPKRSENSKNVRESYFLARTPQWKKQKAGLPADEFFRGPSFPHRIVPPHKKYTLMAFIAYMFFF